MTDIRVGMLVQIWTATAPYGVVTKINKKSFVVNAQTRFNLIPSWPRSDPEHETMNKAFRCTLLLHPRNPIHDIYHKYLYKADWFTPEIDAAIHSVYPNL